MEPRREGHGDDDMAAGHREVDGGVSGAWGASGAEAEKARLVGTVKAGLSPAQPLLGIYLMGPLPLCTVIEYKGGHLTIV